MSEVIVAGLERLAYALEALAAAQVDQSRILESLALAISRQGRQGTLKIKVEAPPTPKFTRRRKLKAGLVKSQEAH